MLLAKFLLFGISWYCIVYLRISIVFKVIDSNDFKLRIAKSKASRQLSHLSSFLFQVLVPEVYLGTHPTLPPPSQGPCFPALCLEQGSQGCPNLTSRQEPTSPFSSTSLLWALNAGRDRRFSV